MEGWGKFTPRSIDVTTPANENNGSIVWLEESVWWGGGLWEGGGWGASFLLPFDVSASKSRVWFWLGETMGLLFFVFQEM